MGGTYIAAAMRDRLGKVTQKFASGGFTGGIVNKIAGFVHGKEFVFSAPAVDKLGVEFLENLHNVSLTRPGYAAGGHVGARGGSGGGDSGGGMARPIINQALFLDINEARRWLLNAEGEREIIALIDNNRVELGL
jgi:hypothetical protein